jgi:hypothetical protein
MEWQPEHRKCVTRFNDGTEAHACPHDTDAYRAHAAEKGTGDVDQYCWSHDIAHIIVAIMAGRCTSLVLWNLAHGLPVDTPECQAEEDAAQEFQRKFFMRS